MLSVEPDTAACVLASLTANHPVTVPTGATVMAGLNCGTVSSNAWPVLRDGCDAAVAVSDHEALTAVADLVALGISSGPSGAATLAGVRAALGVPERRADLGLPENAVVVLLNTEGDHGNGGDGADRATEAIDISVPERGGPRPPRGRGSAGE